jgi:AcrR family transcriptional regulator
MKISGEERRQQILEIARGICAEKGFAGTTLDDIADGADVSRALVVQHFGSKEGVYDALAELAARAHPLEEDPQLKGKIHEKDDYGVFYACASHVFEHNLADTLRSNLRLTTFSMLENRELFEKMAEGRDRAWDGVVSYIGARQREGALKPVDARHLVEGFKCMVVHLAAEVISGHEQVDSQDFYDVIDTMIDLILSGIKTEA